MRHERRQVFLHSFPDDAQVYAKVLVRQDIAQPAHPAPRYLRVASQQIVRKIGRGLTDDLQVALDGVHGFGVGAKGFVLHPGDVARDVIQRVENVLDSELPMRLSRGIDRLRKNRLPELGF